MNKITGRNTPSLGRARIRKPDSPKRAPFLAYIWTTGVKVDQADRDYVRRKLGRKLGKYESSIERVSVRIEDINGPRGGSDKRCRIKVVLHGLPSVVVEQQHVVLQATIDGALERVGRTVTQRLQRRRVKSRARGTRISPST